MLGSRYRAPRGCNHLCMHRPRWRRLHAPLCAATGDFPWTLERILDRQLLAFESYMKCRPLNRTVLPLLDFKLSTQKRFLKARRKQKRSIRVETYWRTRDSMDVIDRFKDNLRPAETLDGEHGMLNQLREHTTIFFREHKWPLSSNLQPSIN